VARLIPNSTVQDDHCISVPGGTVAVEWSHPVGAKTGAPVLVFLHEGLGCISMWKDFPAAVVAATDCPALTYDRLGHGKSSPAPGTERAPRGVNFFQSEAFDILPAVLDAAGIAPTDAVLVGHSDGGTIALLHAGRFPVRAVITEAAHVFVDDVSVAGLAAARKAWRDTDLEQRLMRHHGANTVGMFTAWSSMWSADWFRDWNIEGALPDVTCPVLAIQGEDDEYGTMAQLDAIARGVAGPVETLRVPNCGHAPHVQARAAVEAAFVGFIDALDQYETPH
jgi:pimeloyl-ACP methyl ester carboxylesterase